MNLIDYQEKTQNLLLGFYWKLSSAQNRTITQTEMLELKKDLPFLMEHIDEAGATVERMLGSQIGESKQIAMRFLTYICGYHGLGMYDNDILIFMTRWQNYFSELPESVQAKSFPIFTPLILTQEGEHLFDITITNKNTLDILKKLKNTYFTCEGDDDFTALCKGNKPQHKLRWVSTSTRKRSPTYQAMIQMFLCLGFEFGEKNTIMRKAMAEYFDVPEQNANSAMSIFAKTPQTEEQKKILDIFQ